MRPVYAPALVAWVGGPHFGVGVAVGAAPAVGVAWFPLGPRDVFCPAYHVSQTYVTNVNVSNTVIVNRTQVTNVYNNVYVNKTTVNVTNVTYQNQSVNGAVTATSSQAFTSAQPVHNNMITVNQKEIASAPVAPMTPAVAPQPRSVLGAGAAAKVTPPAAVASRPVVAKVAPPPAPVSFAKQQQLVQANGGRPPAMSQIRQAQPEASAAGRVNASANASVKMAPPVRQGPAQNAPPNRATADAQHGSSNRPGNTPANQGNSNQSGNAPANQGNSRAYNDRPPTSRPGNASDAPSSQSSSNRQGTPNNASASNPPSQASKPASSGNAASVPANQSNSNRQSTSSNANASNPPARENPPSQASKPVNTSANQGKSQANNNNRPPSASPKPAKQNKPAKQDKAEKSDKSDKPHH